MSVRVTAALMVAAAALAASVCWAQPAAASANGDGAGGGDASAGSGDASAGGGDGGVYAEARIQFTKNGKSGSDDTTRSEDRTVPATCWWEPISADLAAGPDVDPDDPESVRRWFEQLRASAGHADELNLPTEAVVVDAIRRVERGEKLTWYYAQCIEGVDPVAEGFVKEVADFDGLRYTARFAAFLTGQEPEPLVPAQTLAELAREELKIPSPVIKRNPQIPGVNNGTLVGFPTWFWVENSEAALGGSDGVHTVTARVGGADDERRVEATVTARLRDGGLVIESEGAERTDCSPAQASVAYPSRADPRQACTVTFTRASVGRPAGFAVTASTSWGVTWEGREADGTPAPGPDDPPLPTITTESTVNVPVAESQAVVRGD